MSPLERTISSPEEERTFLRHLFQIAAEAYLDYLKEGYHPEDAWANAMSMLENYGRGMHRHD